MTRFCITVTDGSVRVATVRTISRPVEPLYRASVEGVDTTADSIRSAHMAVLRLCAAEGIEAARIEVDRG